MIQANIANFVRQEVRVPKTTPLLPVFEAISNALDAIADGKGTGTVRVTVRRHRGLLDSGRGSPHSFIIEDDGIGFNDENIAAFDELYSIRKLRQGGKGRGRFTFLKVFLKAEIHSTFLDAAGVRKRRDFVFDTEYVGCKEAPLNSDDPVGTKVILADMRQDFADNVPREAYTVAKELISHFLPMLLSDCPIEIVLEDEEEIIHLARLVRSDLLIESERDEFQIGLRTFSVHSVKLRPKLINLRHRLILAAAAREVRGHNLDRAIPVLAAGPLALGGEPDGFFFVAVVEGAFLDEAVDPMRITFTDEDEAVPQEDEAAQEQLLVTPTVMGDLFGEPRSISQIRREAITIVRRQLEPYIEAAIAERADAIDRYIRRDGMGYHFLKEEIPELAKTLKSTDDRTIEASLHTAAYIERQKRSAQARELLSVSPKEKAEDTYFQKWTNIVDKLGDVAKSDLANYVAHRRVIIDLVEDKLKTTPEGGYSREEVLHSIVFPRGKQSGQVGYEQLNLWLIDERLTFHEHLYSDLTIRRITGGDVDSSNRPDLAIYESDVASFYDGARPPAHLVLIELKQPGRTSASRDDPVSKTLDYVEKLKSGRAKTEGNAVIDVEPNALTTVYIIADWTADFQRYLDREEFQAMPGDVGRYRFRSRENIIFFAMSFERLLESARRRNRIFFKKLGIEQ
jgi:hypothetical protein